MMLHNERIWLNRHTERQLLQHTVQLIITRIIKIKAHCGEPLNEAADALAAAAAKLDPARAVEPDLDPEAIHFLFKEKWVEWDTSLREDLAQKAAEQCARRPSADERARRRCCLPCLLAAPT